MLLLNVSFVYMRLLSWGGTPQTPHDSLRSGPSSESVLTSDEIVLLMNVCFVSHMSRLPWGESPQDARAHFAGCVLDIILSSNLLEMSREPTIVLGCVEKFPQRVERAYACRAVSGRI